MSFPVTFTAFNNNACSGDPFARIVVQNNATCVSDSKMGTITLTVPDGKNTYLLDTYVDKSCSIPAAVPTIDIETGVCKSILNGANSVLIKKGDAGNANRMTSTSTVLFSMAAMLGYLF